MSAARERSCGPTGDSEPQEAEEFTFSTHCSELSRKQNEQRKSGLFCDVTLVFSSGGGGGGMTRTVSAHRSVLSAASEYFRLLLGGQFSESVSGRVELKEWSSATGPEAETVEVVIQFMYTGHIRVTAASVHEVLELADRFLLAQLKNFCGAFLMEKLNLSNCIAVHSLAHMYTLDHGTEFILIYHNPWIYTPVRTVLAIWHQLTKSEIPELAKCSVLMKERSRVEETIYAMQRAGAGSLQVISDFDMTLTRFAHNGTRVPTTHNILDNRLLIDEDCTKKMRELLNTYYPIEIDAGRTAEEKLPLMVEWWTEVHELLIQQKIRKDMLAKAVKESSAMLRDGYKLFFDHLTEQRVPLLIFSAGVGDVLEEVIRQNHVFYPNVHIISNYMDFDQTGVLRAFKGQLIHSFNKREGALSHAAGLRELQGRPNVLLLGDSLGDLTMADGVSEHQNILTIGFLNDKVEERKESYINSFDIVLVQDETMDVANAILRYITSLRHK